MAWDNYANTNGQSMIKYMNHEPCQVVGRGATQKAQLMIDSTKITENHVTNALRFEIFDKKFEDW